MNPIDLLTTAREMVGSARRRPSQVVLKREISTCYYALFHALAGTCAESLVGGKRAGQGTEPWRHLYRALNHGTAKDACKRIDSSFLQPIQDFAGAFVRLQGKRHAADYDPAYRAFKSDVLMDIEASEGFIRRLWACPAKDRQAFAVWVLFKQRP